MSRALDKHMDVNVYLSESIDRFGIQQIGYLPGTQMPFVVLEEGLVFYGLPEKKGGIPEKWVVGAVKVIKDLEFRFFQSGREYKQHSNHRYQPGDVVVELGAYLGFYSLYAAKQVGPTGRVIAVEMIPQNHAVLNLNLTSNFPKTAVAVPRGIFNRKGMGTAYFKDNQIAGFRKDVIARFTHKIQEIRVEMDTVDNILEEQGVSHVDLMIVQVNGNEIDAFEGMQQSIHTVKNFAIAAPYSGHGVNHKQVISAYLHRNGFEVEIKSGWIFAKRR